MPDVVEDRCPNCGAPLSIDPYGKCSYCSTVIHREVAITGMGHVVAPTPEIIDLIRNGSKIKAIKVYRELTGLGLADAKNAIDAEEERLKAN
ncbi:MAG: ribosomal protein L7/L12 [Candidatus Dormibacteraeota bacterium]|nr:ribosomal protein L7/L12 [Candidatus Dormibacteraeota bacterium]